MVIVQAEETTPDGLPEADLPNPMGDEPTNAELRQAAFVAEADPLFFQWQAGEGTQEQWLAKRAEIRERYPENEASDVA